MIICHLGSGYYTTLLILLIASVQILPNPAYISFAIEPLAELLKPVISTTRRNLNSLKKDLSHSFEDDKS